MKIVIGIGNPGKKYQDTRHNVGHRILDCLAERLKIAFTKSKFSSLISETKVNDNGVVLMKPATYVNRTGSAVAEAVAFYNVPDGDILVVCDDMNLPLGKLRLRKSGSSGGHNGLNSVIERLGAKDFPRLRFGIERPAHQMDPADYVLSRFGKGDAKTVQKAVDNAADAALFWITDGIEACMNKYNV